MIIESPHTQQTLRNWAYGLGLAVKKPDGVDHYRISTSDGEVVCVGPFEVVELFVATARDQNRGYSPVPELDVSKLRGKSVADIEGVGR
ncbi:hypothetical protein [Agromyces sp. NPDC058104]|uniref:hypothetical protein n=1 Tax=Agromyces sp. NPDC058104 TaxID=3346342 RepID=UPI0036DD45F5